MIRASQKNLFLFLLLFLFISSLPAQKKFKKILFGKDSVYLYPLPYYNWDYYENPEMEGFSGDRLSSSGGLFRTSAYLPDGKWVAWYNKPEFGPKSEQVTKMAMIFYCKGGKADGPAIVYGRSGKIVARGDYRQGNKQGVWAIYTSNGKILKEKVNYADGVPDGFWECYQNGKLQSRLHFSNGKKDGEQISIYPNGKTHEISHYKKGVASGESMTYYPNGQTERKVNYEQDTYSGWYMKWSAKGVLTEKEHYLNMAEKDSLMKLHAENDSTDNLRKLMRVYNFSWVMGFDLVGSVRDGDCISWWENGQLQNKSYFRQNEKIYGDTTYDEKGHISNYSIDSLVMGKIKTARITRTFHPNGQLAGYDLNWPDSMTVSKAFSPQGKLISYSRELAYPYPEQSFTATMEDTIVMIKRLIEVENRELTPKGIVTKESHRDPVAETYTLLNKTEKGIPESEEQENGNRKKEITYDKKGKVQEITWYSGIRYELYPPRLNRLYRRSYNINTGYSFTLDSTDYFQKGIPLNGFQILKSSMWGHAEGVLSNGRMTGHWKHYSGGKEPASESDYLNNQQDGIRFNYQICSYNYQLYGHSKPFRYLKSKTEYHKGRRNGMQTDYMAGGQIDKTFEYTNNRLNGKETTYYLNGNISRIRNYKDDQMEGNMKEWGIKGVLMTDRNYVDGKKNGKLNTWYDNGIKEMEGQYEAGRKTGEWTHYFRNGVVKAKVTFRTDKEADAWAKTKGIDPQKFEEKHRYYNPQSTDGYLETDVNNGNLEEHHAHLTYYFENSTRAQEGDIYNGIRVGLWTWWREDGSKEKEVDYTPGKFIPLPGDTLEYNGKYSAWHENGKKYLEALIMNEDKKYDCRKEVQDLIQNLYYLNGWDEAGAPAIVEGKGYVKSIGAGGIVRSEGAVREGVKDGPWIYRDENGNLNSTGSYALGLEDGKWLMGDLAGVHSIENACFRDLTQEELDLLLKELEVTETWYLKGDVQKMIMQSTRSRIFSPKQFFHAKSREIIEEFNVMPGGNPRYEGIVE